LHFKDTRNDRFLTALDRHLLTRTAYAMVVSGLWTQVRPRRCASFDFYEIVDRSGRPGYRVGRLADGKYALLNLRSGMRKSGGTMAEVLRQITYVPNTRDPARRP